ncbi:ABC transporter permease [Carboxydochorda subterranea]|uniref:ABC transporter permease n=1 Tax=Carboxydichorda subterranea TaxID=3109565 RepID=A0ABZ1BTW9_9FIRM|nr:ABC transporter permease [Limnochorda sp. L945t]WRP16270.1 ABC transporter permease [Limnochorda sp. L945t]
MSAATVTVRQICKRYQSLGSVRLRQLGFVAGRALRALATAVTVVTLTFFIIRLMPGNPIEVYVTQLIAQYGIPYAEALNQAAALFSLDLRQPLWQQYLHFLGNLASGNLGTSFLSPGTPVTVILGRFLPWTLLSVGTGLLLSFTIGMGLGMVVAYRRGSWLDQVLSSVASLMSSVPNYLIAMMILVLLGVQWPVLPIHQMRGVLSPGTVPSWSAAFVGDVLYHAALPIATYVLTTVGFWMLTMKNSTLSALEEDYVTVARARGLPERRILTAYVGRNASLPLFTQLTIAAGFVVGGSLLIEYVFVYQGIGLLLISSINQRDYPVMQGVFLLITISVILANLLTDLLYSRIDPRIRIQGGE